MIDQLKKVGEGLNKLGIEYAFLGGCVVPLLCEQAGGLVPRYTKDVDATIQVGTLKEMEKIENQLRNHGFQNDSSEGAPICRWSYDAITVDLIPAGVHEYGMNVDFFPSAIEERVILDIGISGIGLPVVSASHFILLKLLAFQDRGKKDWQASHDLEDIVTVINGRNSFPQIKYQPARCRLKEAMHELEVLWANQESFFASHLDRTEMKRIPLLVQRWNSLKQAYN